MEKVISVKNLNKTYEGGFQALKNINLEIEKGEIFALLGPNGAGKTTMISIICGVSVLSEGEVTVGGYDIVKNYREARSMIGLVPQELTTGAFETVWETVAFTRGLFGLAPDDKLLEKVLKDLSLWDKKDSKIMTLSGGMKRRVLIAKALSHSPKILFLDEPTAGVDVDLRKDMWDLVGELRKSGVTIILTTHYIEEAEEMADRISVIRQGEIIVTEKKEDLLNALGKKQLEIELSKPMSELPVSMSGMNVKIDGNKLIYSYDKDMGEGAINSFLKLLIEEKVCFKDIHTKQSSLEEIFVGLVNKK